MAASRASGSARESPERIAGLAATATMALRPACVAYLGTAMPELAVTTGREGAEEERGLAGVVVPTRAGVMDAAGVARTGWDDAAAAGAE